MEVVKVDFNKDKTEFDEALIKSSVDYLTLLVEKAKLGDIRHMAIMYEDGENDLIYSLQGAPSDAFQTYYALQNVLIPEYENVFISGYTDEEEESE